MEYRNDGADAAQTDAATLAAQVLATQQQWLEEARLVREKLGKAGTASRDIIASYSGIEFLQGILAGRIDYPPIADTLNFSLLHVEAGRVLFQGIPQFAHYNPIGSVHGGWFATLLDSALGCAVQSKLPRGVGYTTLELKVNLIRALTSDTGPVRAEGHAVHVGRQTGISEARLYDAAGKLYATASTTCLIFPLDKK